MSCPDGFGLWRRAGGSVAAARAFHVALGGVVEPMPVEEWSLGGPAQL